MQRSLPNALFPRLRLRLSLRNTTEQYEPKNSHYGWTRNGGRVNNAGYSDSKWYNKWGKITFAIIPMFVASWWTSDVIQDGGLVNGMNIFTVRAIQIWGVWGQ
jgi:hypothetical protein